MDDKKPNHCCSCGSHHTPPPPPPPGAVASGMYICPMCPGVRQEGPGDCPICGMPLEPEMVTPGAPEDQSELKSLRWRFWVGLVLTLPVFYMAMRHHNAVSYGMGWLQWLLTTPVVFWVGWPFFQKAWRSIVTRNLNMFTLIGLGVGAAYGFSTLQLLWPQLFPMSVRGHYYFESAAVITVLVILGQLMELRARSNTSKAIRELLALTPERAIRITPNGDEEVAVSELKKGDRLRVRPGDRVPVDGVILEGRSHIDQSMLTGESQPEAKEVGDAVSAGTVNVSGALVIQAERIGSETVLARIVQRVAEAQRSRAPIQNLADTVAGYFVPVVVGIAVLAFAAWMILGPEPRLSYAWVSAISVLVIACPCALGLATPMSVMVGVGRGAQAGVLIRNASALQAMEKITTLVVDKTGTLTEGKPEVVGFALGLGAQEDSLLVTASSLEIHSAHPLAAAIVRAARERNLAPLPVENFENVTGLGLRGVISGVTVLVGRAALLEQAGVTIPNAANSQQLEGHTQVHVALGERWLGAIAVADRIRATTPDALAELASQNIKVVMLTGDNPKVAAKVAGELGITEFHAGVLPEDKYQHVLKLQQEGEKVAMAGDGINDAPALAQADVGIAMGTGTDIAIESAEITLVKGDLRGIVRALHLSRAVLRNIRQNLLFAFIYNLVGIPIAAGALYPFFGWLLSPMIAGAAMSLSSVSVITNALRLRFAKIN